MMLLKLGNSLELFDKIVFSLEDSFDKFLLWDWHRTLKKGSIDDEINNIGKWKKYENTLLGSDLKLCKPHLVDIKIFNLLRNFEESNKDLYAIADFHQQFEHIHPFQDGNGRIGRFIIFRQCIINNIDLITIDNEYSKEYKQALYIAQTTNDVSLLVEVFIKCQHRLDAKLIDYLPIIEQVSKEKAN